MLSYEQFAAELAPLKAALAQRRLNYLRYFYAGVLAGGAVLLSSLFAAEAVLHAIQRPFGVSVPLTSSDITAFRLFAWLCTAMLALGPVISYREMRGLSVEHAVLGRLFGHFGPFIPAKGGGISVAELKKAGFAAGRFLLYPEEGVSGEMNGVRVRLCEASLLARRKGERDRLVFHGLLALCDTEYLSAAPGSAAVELSQAEHGRLSALAEHPAPPFLAARWDEKTLYAGLGAYARLKDAFISWAGKNELPSEKAYRLDNHVPQRLARHGAPREAESGFAPYTVEHVGRSCLIMMAGHHRFLALGSLFTPPLSEGRLRHFYEVMEMLNGVTQGLAARPAAISG